MQNAVVHDSRMVQRWALAGAVLVFALALGWRLFLIASHPVVYSFDAFTRLWASDTLFVRHWLPLPQLPVMALDDDLALLRTAYAFLGAAASVALAVAVAQLWGLRHGVLVGALAWAHPHLVHWTLTPYQEGPMVLFLAAMLACWPRGLHAATPLLGWTGGVCAALACLCRYEGWLLALIFVPQCLARDRRHALRYLAPAAIVMVGWLAAQPMLEHAFGPPRIMRPFAPLWQVPLAFIPDMMARTSSMLLETLVLALTWPGIVLMTWGLYVAYRSAGVAGRELLLFLLVLLGLAVLRSWASGILSTRMTTVFACFALPYAVLGLWNVVDRLSWRHRWLITASATVALLASFHPTTMHRLQLEQSAFSPEAALARELGKLPSDLNVRVEPRKLVNTLGESLIGAVFAQNRALDWRDARWSFEGKPESYPQNEPQALITWSSKRRAYHFQLKDGPNAAVVDPTRTTSARQAAD